MFAYVGRNQNLKDQSYSNMYTRKQIDSLGYCDPKKFALVDTGLYCGSRLRSGEVFAYVGRNQNLKDLKDWSLCMDS